MGYTKQKFCEHLRIARQKCGLKQAEAANAIGRTLADAWSRLERGKADSITIEMMLGIARFCKDNKISLDWLLLGDTDIEQGKVVCKHGFNYVDVAADRKFFETATEDEIIIQLGRTLQNEKLLQALLKCIMSNGDRNKILAELYENQEAKNDKL